MLTLTVDEAALFNEAGQATWRRVRLVDGTDYFDLTDIEGEDFLAYCGDVLHEQDEPFAKATFGVKREINRLSFSPLKGDSKINSYVGVGELLKTFRECVIEVASIERGATPISTDWREIFRGDIVGCDFAESVITVDALDLGHRLMRQMIETERTYSPGGITGAEVVMQEIIDDNYFDQESNTRGTRWAASGTVSDNEIVFPTVHNGFYYRVGGGDWDMAVPTAEYSVTEPTWPTTVGATLVVDAFNGIEVVCERAPCTLAVPVSPVFVISKPYLQKCDPVFEALNQIVKLFAWDLRYIYNETDGEWQLTLIQPDRDKVAVDYTWHPDTRDSADANVPSYLGIDEAAVNAMTVRNVVKIVYSDTADLDATGAPKRKSYTATDTTSIAKYERLFMQVAEAATSPIDSLAEATVMGDNILKDMKDPLLSHTVVLPLFYAAQLGDLYTLKANGVHYDSDQTLAVVSIRHNLDAGETVVGCRGKPCASIKQWLLLESRPGVAKPAPFTAPGVVTSLAIAKVVGGVSVTWAPPISGTPWKEFEVHIGTAAAFVISSATLACTVAGDRADLADLDPGTTYYCRVVARDAEGNRGAESAEVSTGAGYAGPLELYPAAFSQGFMPPNGSFEAQTDAGLPPDGWAVSTGTWGTDVVLDSTDASSGSRSLKLIGGIQSPLRVVSQYFPVMEGVGYVTAASWKHNTTGVIADDAIGLRFYDASFVELSAGAGLLLSDSLAWTRRVSAPSVAPSGARFAAAVAFKDGADDPDTLWVDNVQVIQVSPPPTWTAPTLVNSWANYGGGRNNVGYTKTADGRVTLRGAMKDGSGAAFTLPSGYRPPATVDFACAANANLGGGYIFGHVNITSAGVVTPTAGSNAFFSLEGISFFTD